MPELNVVLGGGGGGNHPKDPRGATNKGVTQKAYDAWRTRNGLGPRDVRQLEDGELHAICEEGYWLPPRCDLLQRQLDLVRFDAAVNMGPKRAVKFLQQSVGCAADGDFGPTTKKAAENCDLGTAIARYCDVREACCRGLAERNPDLKVFMKGWMNRLNALCKEVGLPGYEAAVPLDFGDADHIAEGLCHGNPEGAQICSYAGGGLHAAAVAACHCADASARKRRSVRREIR